MKNLFLLILLMPVVAFAQNKPYSLFNPVPKAQMREMETDRPDVTESPYTVDAGHMQYEADLLRYVKQKDEETWYINNFNVKLGLARSTAIQLGFETYAIQQDRHGIGDFTLRVKQNLIGNDHGNFVLAVLPYVKFPTGHYAEDDTYEGGIIVPMVLKLPGEWQLGMQVEADRLKDEEGTAMHTELLQTLAISHPLIKHLDFIGETYYRFDLKQHHWTNYLNAALKFSASDNVQLDAGINYGVQHDADKHYFAGLSFRL